MSWERETEATIQNWTTEDRTHTVCSDEYRFQVVTWMEGSETLDPSCLVSRVRRGVSLSRWCIGVTDIFQTWGPLVPINHCLKSRCRPCPSHCDYSASIFWRLFQWDNKQSSFWNTPLYSTFTRSCGSTRDLHHGGSASSKGQSVSTNKVYPITWLVSALASGHNNMVDMKSD